MHSTGPTVTRRGISMLRAVAAGRGRLTCGCEPDLFVGGLPCGDQFTAHALARRSAARAGTGAVRAAGARRADAGRGSTARRRLTRLR
ncbi:hypothetical protein [Amycolatopsis sp. M39]|uniref:hypothetical protein n=1 Tax=Amycolatopsis TaxID=1813 RepID=UPI0007DED129|nr:hypothetical protein A4R44_07497 [Amycolatopsis sp. M39]